MDGASFGNLLLVVAAAVVTPLMLGLTPRLRLPAVVLEILAGVAIGPSGLGFAAVDATVAALSLLGLAFLLFLAGAEIRFDTLGPLVWPASLGFLLSLGLGLLAGYVFEALGVIDSSFLLALTLSATALGIVVGVLNQTG
jgi:Kef-type K+ transport system membrane component KefB